MLYAAHGLQEKFCKVEQDCFGARGQAENASQKIEKKLNKTSMTKVEGPFRDSQVPS